MALTPLFLLPLLSITIGLDPVAFALGGVEVHWYGVMYVVGIAIGAWVTERIAPRMGANVDALWDLFPIAIFTGLMGGRLYFVVQDGVTDYLRTPGDIFAVWDGGMAFFGAIMAVVATIFVFARWRGLSPWPMFDAVSVFAVIGQVFGRIGNIVNGDVIGAETSVPWGTAYTHPDSFAPAFGVPYHPAAAYSMIANVLLLGVIYLAWRRYRYTGVPFATYLVGYSVTQFVIFFWRNNSITAFGLKQAQLTAIVIGLLGAALLYWRLRERVPVVEGGEQPRSAAPPPTRAERRRRARRSR
ncbi:MAG: prolipoprotein diacylglyceryl transferase [Dehalococcoidia bacterium]